MRSFILQRSIWLYVLDWIKFSKDIYFSQAIHATLTQPERDWIAASWAAEQLSGISEFNSY